MTPLEQFLAAIRAAIVGAWPEVEPNGIWLAVSIESFSFEEMVNADRLPLCVFQLSLRSDPDAPLTAPHDSGDLVVSYVDRAAGPETPEQLLLRAEVLRDALYRQDLEYGHITDWPSVSVDEHVPANEYFINRNMPFRAAQVTVPVRAPTFTVREALVGPLPWPF